MPNRRVVARACAGALLGLAAVAASAARPVVADPVDLPIGEAGLTVTLEAAETFREGVPYAVSGHVYAVAAAPLVLEVSRGVPEYDVDILVDGARRATTTTQGEGHFRVDLHLTGEGAPHTVQAVVNCGTPAEARSPERTTRLDQVYTDLSIDPRDVTVAVGGSTQLRATVLDGDGRQSDVTGGATWTSSDPAVARVDGGRVTGVSVGGPVVITATYRGVTAQATVTVTDDGRG